MTLEEIKKLADNQWEGCQGCDDNDKNFWINGFVQGYLNARVDNVDDRIQRAQQKIAELLINGNTKEQQKRLITEIMEADEKDGLYEQTNEEG